MQYPGGENNPVPETSRDPHILVRSNSLQGERELQVTHSRSFDSSSPGDGRLEPENNLPPLSADIRLPTAFLLALIATTLAVPAAILVANRWGLLDHPKGWKRHQRATPYLGGATLLCGFSIAALAFAGGFHSLEWLLLCSMGLCVLGTLDDRRDLTATARLLATAAAAVVLWNVGLGWTVFASGAANLLLTVLWVVAVVNAINLLDLLDGAAASTVAACVAACAAVAGVFSDTSVAVLALALCGSCLGFLRYNLRRPSAIFLGDGGTMPLGLLTATLIETLSWGKTDAFAAIAGAVLLCGLPIFDMTFRVFSRLRRGDTLLTAGPDSIANWLLARMPSTRWVALVLGLIQAMLGSIAVLAADLGSAAQLTAGICALVLGGSLMALLDASGFGHHLVIDRQPTGRRGRTRATAASLMDASNDSG
jgi:UDP-GlcNAc:undecaprenyl-phosphate/decaprenyl-phosphate GlcNAc-1-phosphate transferase